MEKPRMREMYGIWSCIGLGAWGAGWSMEAAFKDWLNKYGEHLQFHSKNKCRNQRFG